MQSDEVHQGKYQPKTTAVPGMQKERKKGKRCGLTRQQLH